MRAFEEKRLFREVLRKPSTIGGSISESGNCRSGARRSSIRTLVWTVPEENSPAACLGGTADKHSPVHSRAWRAFPFGLSLRTRRDLDSPTEPILRLGSAPRRRRRRSRGGLRQPPAYYVTTDKFSISFTQNLVLYSCQCRNAELIGMLEENQFSVAHEVTAENRRCWSRAYWLPGRISPGH